MKTHSNADPQHAPAHKINLGELTVGLLPAFRDSRTGETHLAQTPEKQQSDVHEFTHLPDDWVLERDAQGNAMALHPAILAGYWRGSDFIAVTGVLQLPIDA